MSNDSEFTLRFRHKKKRYLEQVREYAEQKKSRWDEFKAESNNVRILMKRVGAKKPNEVVSWGFDFDRITKNGTGYCLTATAWANENSSNVHITGEEGELADLLSKFPELEIEGEFSDEYGWGSLSEVEKDYEGEGEQYEEDDLNSGLLIRYRYYPNSERLKLEFSDGAIYSYEGVSRQEVDGLTKAESKGKYFNSHIRNVHEGEECSWDD